MEQLSFGDTYRRNADKNLITILLVGLGGSLAFHILAIAGVAHWWKPVAPLDEPMEITMVDVDTEKPPEKPVPQPTGTPPKVEPQPKPVPIVKTPDPQPVPIVKVPAKLEPKPVPIVKTRSSDNFRDRVPSKPLSKPVPKSIEPPLKTVTSPAFPDKIFKPAPAKTSAAPTPKAPKDPESAPQNENQSELISRSPSRKIATRSTDTPSPTQEQDFGQMTPSKVNAPTEDIAPSNNNQSGLANNPTNSSKLAGKLAANNNSSTTDDNFGEVTPSKIKTPTNDDFVGSSSNQAGLASNPSGGKLGSRLAANNNSSTTDDNFGEVTPSKIKAPTNDDFVGSSSNQSGLASKPNGGGKLGNKFAGTNLGNNTSDDNFDGVSQGNSWRGARAEPGAGLKPNPVNNTNDDNGSGGGLFGLQCINRCEISGLTDLEDRDGGKDKLRIKIAIDPKGNVTRASIAKSSGNSTIDQIVINGVKQMQFSPPGKVVERVVKANILL